MGEYKKVYQVGDCATVEELAAHTSDLNNPHQVTKGQLGISYDGDLGAYVLSD